VSENFGLASISAAHIGKFDEAYKYAEKSVNADPSAMSREVFINALYNVGRKDEARIMLHKALELNPNEKEFIELKNAFLINSNANHLIPEIPPAQ
jgi:tetratricopeptide (TPR) repeat protein